MSKIRIVSDGDPLNTKVFNVDGEIIGGITKATWTITAKGSGTAILEFEDVAIDAECETE